MDPIKSESRKNERRGLQHIGHDHPLVLFQLVASEEEDEVCYCLLCGKPVRGWSYSCNECDVYIHKVCAESELQPQLNHPFHPQHPITFSPKSPYQGSHECTLCGRNYRGFVYHCATCRFTLHFNCALLQSSMSANFPVSLHPHPLFFIENHKDQVKYDCSGCKKSLSGPIYHCPHCSSESNFNLHKKCGELSLEIDHSYDLNHPLTLLPKPPAHREKCSCDLCKIKWDGFVYSCSLCNIDLSISDFVSPTITDASHDHPWRLIFRKMSFLCDFCGTAGDGSPYLCTECNLLVHKKCISLPRGILITRHQHGIYLSYSLRRNRVEDWTCRICYNEVDMTWYKYDKHALTLTYSDDSDPSRLYCDLCENERRPNDWFYCCADCDNSLHSNCAIGDLPYIKVGNKIGIRCNRHERRPRFTLVKNIWNCPPCKVCGELCNGQALECKEPQRNFNIHWGCRNSSYVYETER
ncbi:uncharacterized protein LOC120115118 isoform X2 [Hibiscus syriacus]|uniref:uncharacterized protein LOC120115118 isoform X2 n=1 Tax=Hibiscus syriacus TaxID=106335 RepID=UPI0019230136|nr:uncharacterized protein LOC120115118 isoform X2 [Hibiscus syriacus]